MRRASGSIRGVYDIASNQGWVNVGVDHDIGEPWERTAVAIMEELWGL